MTALASSVIFAALAMLLYLCTADVLQPMAPTTSEAERRGRVCTLGGVLVFVLVLWLRLEAA